MSFASLESGIYPEGDIGNPNTHTSTQIRIHGLQIRIIFPANHRPGPKLKVQKPDEKNNNKKT